MAHDIQSEKQLLFLICFDNLWYALMIFNAFHSTSGLHGRPRNWSEAPWKPLASTLAPAEISFSATALKPFRAAQCSAVSPWRVEEVTVSIGRQDHDRKHPVVMAISCLGAWLIQDYKRYWWRISSQSFLVPSCAIQMQKKSWEDLRSLLSHFARQPIKYRSFLVSIITITQIYEKIKNHLRNIQSGVMVLSPLHQTSSKPSWSFRRFWGHHHCHSVPPRRRRTSAAARPPRCGRSLLPGAVKFCLGHQGDALETTWNKAAVPLKSAVSTVTTQNVGRQGVVWGSVVG